ncbi:MAG: eukaryotic-like serine/threonine-protein kinase [Acidobacteriaceae bacterium]|nr:eukaryotic-like serine/threonine-protein kinase [Acidobacteriaceae bacterium]
MAEFAHRFSEGELVAGNYRILGVAGRGGMGIVYRARDLRLERMVALKFLPDAINSAPHDVNAFLREARTASSLDHANIGVIHGIEHTENGSIFIVMAFYEGRSLADRIRDGALPPREAIEIACQMCAGLAEAHAHGILHRDIKPSNVMLTGSHVVKIVDFGLAKFLSDETASQVATAGTVAYMSPEQSMAKNVDFRTDLWAVGVVLAEMLTAQSPFQGASVTAVLFAILNEPPKGIERVHPELQKILFRCLAKDPEKRYSTAIDLQAALEEANRILPSDETPAATSTRRETSDIRRAREAASRSAWSPPAAPRRLPYRVLLVAAGVLLAAALTVFTVPAIRRRVTALGTHPVEQKHIAVLPFEILGHNADDTALADGLMDSLAGRLSNLDVGNQSLWVVPNSEVRRRKISDPQDALKELNANLVVKGSVERNGSNVRLHVNLIDTKDLRQVGSVEVQDQAGDFSTLEDESVARLARLMNLSVTAEMLRKTGGAVNPAAYEDYLTAVGYMQRYDKPGNLDLAVTALENAVRTDPKFALAYAQLGEAYRLRYRTDHNSKWLVEAEANCRKAIQLDDRLSDVYVTLGRIHDSAGKHDLALQEFQHALDLNPRDATALAGTGMAYANAGKLPEAEAAYRKAVDLRPNDWDGYNNLGMFLQQHNKVAEAITQYQHALQLTPDNGQVLLNLGGAYADAGDPHSLELAESALSKSIEINPTYAAYANLGFLLYRTHRYPESMRATQQALRLNGSDYSVWDNLRMTAEWMGDQPDAQSAASREVSLLRDYINLHPQDANAVATFANVASKYGPRDQALPHIRTALALASTDPDVLETIAITYENLGDRPSASKFMNNAFARGYSYHLALDDPEAQKLLRDPAVHVTANQ